MSKKRLRKIARDELARLAFVNSKRLPQTVACDGRRLQWVGIGWVDEGPANGSELAVVSEPKPPKPLTARQSLIRNAKRCLADLFGGHVWKYSVAAVSETARYVLRVRRDELGRQEIDTLELLAGVEEKAVCEQCNKPVAYPCPAGLCDDCCVERCEQ